MYVVYTYIHTYVRMIPGGSEGCGFISCAVDVVDKEWRVHGEEVEGEVG
jgi:hypothetical protein